MSSNTVRKAKKLVDEDAVAKVDEELYQVMSSSDPSKSYFVTLNSCDCEGFQNFYKFHHGKGIKANCSHLQAVKIYREQVEGIKEKTDDEGESSSKDKKTSSKKKSSGAVSSSVAGKTRSGQNKKTTTRKQKA